jgi:hypothetical protein
MSSTYNEDYTNTSTPVILDITQPQNEHTHQERGKGGQEKNACEKTPRGLGMTRESN